MFITFRIRVWIVPDGLEAFEDDPDGLVASSSSSSSNGIVHEDTMEAERRLARDDPEEAEDTDDTVDMVEIGDIVEVLPLNELRPESLLLWLWFTWWLEESLAFHWISPESLRRLVYPRDGWQWSSCRSESRLTFQLLGCLAIT